MVRGRALLAAAILLLVSTGPAAAQEPDADTVRVVHLVIDGLHPSQIGPDTPVLADLKADAVWWEHARAVMPAETLPNHVAMATGAYPERNGIPANTGRAAVGDTTAADPDLGIPALREAASFTTALESTCPDLRTVTVFSKEYVWRTFSEDPADADFPQPMFNIPGSGHAPDVSTVGYINEQLLTQPPPDYLFANLGDVDRAGHIDGAGFTGAPAEQRAALQQTDALVGTVIENLRQQGLWEDTVLVVNSDHSMDWSAPGDPAASVDVEAALEADQRTAGRFFVSENGGAGLVYLREPAAEDADEVLAAARHAILELDGVAEALYREPNPADPGHDLASVHPAWRAGTPRIGELFVHVTEGHKVGSPTSNPIPGNHGHGITRHITMFVTGGWDGLADQTSIGPSDPAAVDVVDDTEALPEQAEQVDLAPTYGWLLGVDEPAPGQWQGRVLDEAFARQPAPACALAATIPPPDAGEAGPSPSPADDAGAGGAPGAPSLPATGGGLALLGLAVLGAVAGVRRT